VGCPPLVTQLPRATRTPAQRAGPGKGVAAQLNGSAQGQQLLHAMRALGSQLLAQATLWPSAAAAHAVLQSLQDAHSCVVALDDALDEQRISAGGCGLCVVWTLCRACGSSSAHDVARQVLTPHGMRPTARTPPPPPSCPDAGVAPQLDECRQWLRQAQGFVLALSKQVQGFADDEGLAAAASAEALSSMEEGCSTISAHGSSNGPSSAASLAAWRSTCGEAADALAAAVQQAAAGGAAEVSSGRVARSAWTRVWPRVMMKHTRAAPTAGAAVQPVLPPQGAPSGGQASATRRAGSRLVAQTSRLSYATHWSQKVAI
jgi:hypothetical protein